MLFLLSIFGVGVSALYYIVAAFVAVRFRNAQSVPPPPLPKPYPRAVLLKPLSGVSASLGENLRSFFELDYPRREFVFGVASYDDPATELSLALKTAYRFESVHLSVGEEPDAQNRKVAKLIRMMERVPRSADVLVLSDADVQVERDHLRRVVGELMENERIGVVTCLYRAIATNSLAARFDAAFVNTDFAPMALLSAAFEALRHAFGATIAIKRHVLDEIGGFAAVKDVLADDFFIGNLAFRHGYKVRLSSSLVTVVSDQSRFRDFVSHQVRWQRTYRSVRRASLATILLHGPFWAVLTLIATGFSSVGVSVLGSILALRAGMAALMTGYVLGLPMTLSDIGLVLVKDLAMTAIYFLSLVGNTVSWGGRRYRVLPGGKMREIGLPRAFST